MKSVRNTIAAAAVLAALSAPAFAEHVGGTINFTGEIVGTTCQVSPGDQNKTVTLGRVSQSSLHGEVGKTSEPVQFTINLTGCDDTAKGATLTFRGEADAVNPQLLQLANAGQVGQRATGVAIALEDSRRTRIPVNSDSAEYVIGKGDNALEFWAMYESTGTTVTAGPANAVAQFTITYK